MHKLLLIGLAGALTLTACKNKGCTDPTATNYDVKAKKDDGSCVFEVEETYNIPTTYAFVDASGNSTVDYSGQVARLDMLDSIIAYIELGETQVISAQTLQNMFANNGVFSYTTKQLRDKCFTLDVPMYEALLDSAASASLNNAVTASNGQAGTLTSGTSVYLVSKGGLEYAEVFEKGMMGAVFMYQALNHYFGDDQMLVDNTTAVDPANGDYYTVMAHHWDEAFGYFGVPMDFPTSPATRFWGKYCNSQNPVLGSNAVMMNNFLKGRAAIVANEYSDRDAAIMEIRRMWEKISAYQAMKYLDVAIGYFGNDDGKFMHALSEAYGFARNLRYAPDATRQMTQTEVNDLVAQFGDNFWNLTVLDLQNIKSAIDAKY